LLGVGHTRVDHLNSNQEEEDPSSDSKSGKSDAKKLKDPVTPDSKDEQNRERIKRGITGYLSLVHATNVFYRRNEEERHRDGINEDKN
jgi:hypothetical protein